jgi:hypothetical protein
MLPRAGEERVTADTARNRMNGIPAGKPCWVAFLDQHAISVVIPTYDAGDIKVRVPRDAFGINFRENPVPKPLARAYTSSKHFETLYR